MYQDELIHNGRKPHPMAEFTRHTRLPLERAIEVIEGALEPEGRITWYELKARCRAEAPEAQNLLDHTIKVMIHGGYVRRVVLGPDRLTYQATERWTDRDETLLTLRAPRYKKRFRPRRKGKRVYPDDPTIDAVSQRLESLAASAREQEKQQ